MEYRTYNENMDIVRKYQNPDFVDVETLAGELGMKVCYSKQPVNISGAIFKNEKVGGSRGYVCFVNNTHSTERQRFTIAHEIAHFILHRDYIGDGITDNGLLRSNLSVKFCQLPNEKKSEIIQSAKGKEGACMDYIKNTQQELQKFKISDPAVDCFLE